MTVWLADNWGNIIVSLILIAIVTVVIFRLIKDKKTGKSGCGGNCNSCGMRSSCHGPDRKE